MENEKREIEEIIDTRYSIMKNIGATILNLPIEREWKKIFTNLCIYRTWFNLNKTQQSQMKNIAEINSEAVKILIGEHNKKVGLEKLEKISIEIETEEERVEAMLLILEYGAKQAKNGIDLIIVRNKVA